MFNRSCKIIAFRGLPVAVGAKFALEGQLQDPQKSSISTSFIVRNNGYENSPNFSWSSLFRLNVPTAFCDPGPVRKSMLKYPNGDVYIGEVRSGLRSGHGVMTYGTTGMVYNGEWVDGHMQGNGVMKYADGSVFYEGSNSFFF
jgi:hypothetical protein